MFDESIGTPMIWSWAGKVPALARQVELVSSYDFVPDYLRRSRGCAFHRPFRKQLSAAGHGQASAEKDALAASGVRSLQKYRDGARAERYKWIPRNDGKGPNELYDLSNDPHERVNQTDNEQYISVRKTR